MLFDVNVVLALHIRKHPHHAVATEWFARLGSAGETFGVPLPVWHSFVRLATNHRVNKPPETLAEVFGFVDRMTRQGGYRRIEAGPRHLQVFREVCLAALARENLVPDAVLAAIAIENGATVASFDRDFARFPNLRWIVPGE